MFICPPFSSRHAGRCGRRVQEEFLQEVRAQAMQGPVEKGRNPEGREGSYIGNFDYVPELGYREYWYPALLARKVGRRPVKLVMLGDELVFFRGKGGRIAALRDRCPHRGAVLSFGRCEFEGTISCPYHGFTFDEEGVCVAALTEGPDSGQVGKLKAHRYPTREVHGIVFVWMGATEPVALEEDLPQELRDEGWLINPYVHDWPMNWSLTVENTADAHFSYVHRYRFRRFFNLENFKYLPAYWDGVQIVEEGDNYIGIRPGGGAPQQAFYPGLGTVWPRQVWWRVLKPHLGRPHPQGKSYHLEYRLPSIIRVDYVNRIHMRWPVPIDAQSTRMFTFSLYPAKTGWAKAKAWLHFNTIHRYFVIDGTNEREDIPVQAAGRLDPHAPQRLGRNDRAIIYWRRRMPFKSRDAKRLWKSTLQQGTPDSGAANAAPASTEA
jgi:phenylpropionate dioxygenase-like ring-hydroxylating dioxygenase large terminal subunit